MKQNKWINGAFVLLILLGLLAGLGKTLFRPKEINYYENRYADKTAPLTFEAVMDNSFQDAMEDALADQIPLAQKLKKLYHLCFSTYQRLTVEPLSERLPDVCLNVGGLRLYRGYICYWFRSLSREQADLDRKIENYNRAFAAYPDTEFYLYYIEKDTDLDMETGVRSGVSDYLREHLEMPDTRFGVFSVPDFAVYSEDYYRTDHHWNWRGSYRGYTETLGMLLPGEAPLVPQETVSLGRFSGSKAKGKALAAFREDFYAYRFDFPEMEISVNNSYARDYGNQDIFLSGAASDVLNYGSFYGDDEGIVSFYVPENEGKGELLILGDSFDNAVIKLLASHFENTYAIDLRYYGVYTGQEFKLSAFLAEHPEAKVLLIGNLDYFVLDEFALEG